MRVMTAEQSTQRNVLLFARRPIRANVVISAFDCTSYGNASAEGDRAVKKLPTPNPPSNVQPSSSDAAVTSCLQALSSVSNPPPYTPPPSSQA
ncbi:hypothetical protein KIN20_029490 [Parelaphostrongylus tenuis]|uniref:Uncharacterized protein n=1 Tax=Parelaphostrongylus tenuis TaxID=148309 RepID=A0AAD5R3A5_PARTN|nr:hypothetical protein KIN20_029490 [Parelaphostrongylus tenuis]